ncbi:hypothetical protein HMPREF0971_03219 [Segatella oris F0302]|uniref:Uncharacterized protein n=1 Tax=Segatella oris F0302 TaxID=649760 RepID=D1QW24_9BACT|nr:hypothetical protein HMPREF0971_03219 [Segatella oris F0302]
MAICIKSPCNLRHIALQFKSDYAVIQVRLQHNSSQITTHDD